MSESSDLAKPKMRQQDSRKANSREPQTMLSFASASSNPLISKDKR
jgi:hypothetical protein